MEDFKLFDIVLEKCEHKNECMHEPIMNNTDILCSKCNIYFKKNGEIISISNYNCNNKHTIICINNFEICKKCWKILKNINTCTHEDITTYKNINICMDCGIEVKKRTSKNKQENNSNSIDPKRCQIRKSEERDIYKDVNNMGFSGKIINLANQFYYEVTKGKIYRGNSRKSIVFACVFNAFKINGQPQSCEKLIKIFNLDRKSGLKGLKYVNLNAPRDSPIRTTYITPINLIEETMDKFNATDKQKKEVKDLYEMVKNKSSKINRSRPQSISSSLIYYWILKNNKDICLKNFIKEVNLSELTITKIVKEIKIVLEK